jgi:hypothetical protein
MVKESKKILYDSPEAAQQMTLTGWVSGGDMKFWYKDEHMARWSGCTHLKCECGNLMKKTYTKCPSCIHKLEYERYQKLPYKEWDGTFPVFSWDSNEVFNDFESLVDHMINNEMDVINLRFPEPIHYREVKLENIADDVYDEWEPEEKLVKALDELNAVIRTLPAHSYISGKIRTSYELEESMKDEI